MKFGIYAFSRLFIKKNRNDREKHAVYVIMEDMIKIMKEKFILIINEREHIFDKESRDNLLHKLDEIEFKRKLDIIDISSVPFMETCYKDIGISKMIVLKNISSNSLLEPCFSRHFPHAIICGNIEFGIAYEILHAFDNDHYKHIYIRDKKGKLMLTSESIENFKKKIEYFVKQYNDQKECITMKIINSLLTLHKNIADIGGLNLAHRTYMKYLQSIGGKEPKVPRFENFTSEQLFFISNGRTFCEHESKDRNIETWGLSLKTVEIPLFFGHDTDNKIWIQGSVLSNEVGQ
uniref:Phosphate-regulating neutral endopeptidase (inferred by orthology to a human protein) n=1 Tax=Strongyloides venezuelensis TaxID=75913 RepID=A0A0K0F309_STRVS